MVSVGCEEVSLSAGAGLSHRLYTMYYAKQLTGNAWSFPRAPMATCIRHAI